MDTLKSGKPHGYVYAFFHRGLGWLKVGMTDNPDSTACWNRIRNYAETHGLTKTDWDLVTFIPVREPIHLERRLHSDMRHMLVEHGKAKELFTCSPDFFAGILLADKNQKYLDLKSASKNQKVLKVQARREEEARKLAEEVRLEMAMDLRKSRSNAAARKKYKESYDDWLESTKLFREKENNLSNKSSDRQLGQLGYGLLSVVLIGNYAASSPGKDFSSPWVAIVGVAAGIMCFWRRSQVSALEADLKAIRAHIPPEPRLIIPYPGVD